MYLTFKGFTLHHELRWPQSNIKFYSLFHIYVHIFMIKFRNVFEMQKVTLSKQFLSITSYFGGITLQRGKCLCPLGNLHQILGQANMTVHLLSSSTVKHIPTLCCVPVWITGPHHIFTSIYNAHCIKGLVQEVLSNKQDDLRKKQ